MPTVRPRLPTAADYQALAEFRRNLRQFLHFSAAAARRVGLSPQQYQALLALKAVAEKVHTVGTLAEELLLRHHSAVELVDRLETRGYVSRRSSTADRRKVELHLTPRGEAMIARLAASHQTELARVGPPIRAALARVARQQRH